MDITIKTLSLVNFKGIRSQKIDFNDSITIIGGANGTGKTTLFDAFVWCLFGKDSQDHKQFSIKTMDSEGKALCKLPHEVEVTLQADNQTVRLRRTYTEKWQKKRGAVEEEFTGHEETRYYNDVPLSVAEYSEKINALCKEDVFKALTNPHYFLSQKDDVVRAMLFKMAGDVTSNEVVQANPDLGDLLDKLQGKSIEEYRREVLAQCKRIKDELKGVPIRIEEVQRNMPQAQDPTQLHAAQKNIKAEIAKTEQCMEDIISAYNEANKQNVEIMHALSEAQSKLNAYQYEERNKAHAEYCKALARQKELKNEEEYILTCIERTESQRLDLLQLQQECDNIRERLLAEFQATRENELVFEDSMFVCPTCKREFDTDDIEARKAEMQAHFNEEKANHLKYINEQGHSNNERKFKICKDVDEKENLLDTYHAKLDSIRQDPLYSQQLSKPTEDTFTDSEEYKKLSSEVKRLTEKAKKKTTTMPDVSEYRAKKAELTAQLEEVNSALFAIDTIATSKARIEELLAQQQTLNEELAQYEREDYQIQQYQKIRANMVTERINNLFTCVWFKLYETQINGGEVECCKAMINGVPYSDANNAAKINAGLDIINAMCKYSAITAPIFIDNAESVNNLLPTASQQIRLVVTNDKILTVKFK